MVSKAEAKEVKKATAAHEEIESPWMLMWKRFKKNKIAMSGLYIFVFLLLFVIFGPIISPYDANFMDYSNVNAGPTLSHLLGTDELGRDYLTRIMMGGRVSLMVGLFAVIISVVVGSLVGGVAGYYGGAVDNLMMRITEIVSSFPFLPLAISVSAVLGTSVPAEYKMYITMMVIGLLSWPGLARMIRGQVLSLREMEFMHAAKALGLSDSRIVIRHLLPNTLAYIIVYSTLSMAGAIMSESALSFLGLGVTPPTPTWGNMIQYAKDMFVLKSRPWLWIPPGLCILLAVMSINLIGDGLRDAFDPKSN
jgi:peptide/nickel transport system permease protein